MRTIYSLLFLILFSCSGLAEEEKFNEKPEEHQRHIIVSCIFIAKQYVGSEQTQLKETLESHDKDQSGQISAYRKILARLLDICSVNLQIEEAVKFIEDIKNNEFELDNYKHVLADFKWDDYALTSEKQIDLQLNSQEETLLKYMEELEKQMRDRQKQQEEVQEESQKGNRDDL